MTDNTQPIEKRYQAIKARIHAAARQHNREPDHIQLLAVSKTRPAEAILQLNHLGQHAFGESYLQESLEKIQSLHEMSIVWHFIGPIQSNKSRPIAEQFSWVHSVDRLKLARRLSEQRPASLPPLNICLQVNVSGEASKSGCQWQELEALAMEISQLPRLRLRGLMCIPAPSPDFEQQRLPFARLRERYEELQRKGLELDTLSMGMSSDMEAAIAEGSTMVRIGTDLFGPRL